MVYDAGITAQKAPHVGFVEIVQLNMIFLKPPTEPCDGVSLAWH